MRYAARTGWLGLLVALLACQSAGSAPPPAAPAATSATSPAPAAAAAAPAAADPQTSALPAVRVPALSDPSLDTANDDNAVVCASKRGCRRLTIRP